MSDKSGTALVIPHNFQSGERDRAWSWVYRRWMAFKERTKDFDEVFAGPHEGEGLSRSSLRNIAVRSTVGDTIILADADIALPDEAVLTLALREHRETGRWVIPYAPYTGYHRLTMPTSRWILFHLEADYDLPSNVFRVEHAPFHSVAGCIIMSRDQFEGVGGYDERFIGWGFEDNAFAEAMTLCYGVPLRLNYPIFHLWHPAGAGDSFEGPQIPGNRALYQKYVDFRTSGDIDGYKNWRRNG